MSECASDAMWNMTLARMKVDTEKRKFFRREINTPKRCLVIGIPIHEGESSKRFSQYQYFCENDKEFQEIYYEVRHILQKVKLNR